jgi:RNA polymerase-binding transcription factor DksA
MERWRTSSWTFSTTSSASLVLKGLCLSGPAGPSQRAVGAFIDSAHDIGDASVADEMASEQFTEAERDSAELKQVRDALARVNDGTFGKCIVDGGPIEEQRLDAVPWTPYCLKHEQRLEAGAPPRTRTL